MTKNSPPSKTTLIMFGQLLRELRQSFLILMEICLPLQWTLSYSFESFRKGLNTGKLGWAEWLK
jgi:hypothetical protein